jgi:hypothetical protein
MTRSVALAGALTGAMALSLGCPTCAGSNPSDGGLCPNDTIAPCTDGGVPSYATQVQPLFQSLCVICHAQGTAEGLSQPMYDYAYVHANSGPVGDDIYHCTMPPLNDAGHPMFLITEEQRQVMLTWLYCGAPNN